MRRIVIGCVCILLSSTSVLAQANRDWTKMTVEDANKTLNSSAWGQTQTETDTSEMFYSPTSNRRSRNSEQNVRNEERIERGALNQALSVNYRVRFFSSRPIREALSRIVLASMTEPGPKALEEWQGFVERNFGPFVVVTVSYDAEDGRLLGPVIQAFASATHETIKKYTYLERSDGKRIPLLDYRPPGVDGLGAKFVFSRYLDDGPFLASPKGNVRFVTELSKDVKVNARFSVSNMVVDGKVEY